MVHYGPGRSAFRSFIIIIIQQQKKTWYINTSQQITSNIQPTVEHHNREALLDLIRCIDHSPGDRALHPSVILALTRATRPLHAARGFTVTSGTQPPEDCSGFAERQQSDTHHNDAGSGRGGRRARPEAEEPDTRERYSLASSGGGVTLLLSMVCGLLS